MRWARLEKITQIRGVEPFPLSVAITEILHNDEDLTITV